MKHELDLCRNIDFDKWVCVSPKGTDIVTGCGIIVDVLDIPEKRKGFYGAKENRLYTVMTDFGNTFTFTKEEMESAYVATRKEENPQERYKRQQELLKDAWGKWFKEA